MIAAADRGTAGTSYLAFGAEDAQTTASFLNVACEVAGVDHRVAEVTIDPDDADAVARYGSTLVALSQRTWPTPWFDNTRTRVELDYHPVALDGALGNTISWLRQVGKL